MTFERQRDRDHARRRRPRRSPAGRWRPSLPIKHLGTNGGGFFGANSAHPFENPNALDQLPGVRLHPDLPVRPAWCMFGRMLGNMRHAAVIFGVMLLLFVGMIGWAVYYDTCSRTRP